MKRLVPLLAIVVLIALLSINQQKPLQVKSERPIDVESYADWSVDGVRPGMSLADATEACGRTELLARIDYFGRVYKLYDGKALDWMHSGHFVVDEDDRVISVEGYELGHRGEVRKNYLASVKSMETLIEDQCRLNPPMLHHHKFRSPKEPILVRGVYFETYILGEEPEWLSLCYRSDDLGDCLECMSHLQRMLAEAKRNGIDRPQSLKELSEYAGERFVERLRCPLGGAYSFSGQTVTCSSHPEGPISVTRFGKNCQFWQGAPD